MILAFSLGERVVNHFARRCVAEVRCQQGVRASSSLRPDRRVGWVTTNHFALPGEEDEIAGG
jgi:hypothetical protein